ncbi:MAG: GTPase Era [bacterium]
MTVFCSGFVGILGRPNVGKSTLLNHVCHDKVAIISEKPQTTRNRILGVLHRPGSQIVFLDTPGMHEDAKALNRYMQGVIRRVAEDVDIIVYMVDVTREHGREDELALSILKENKDIPVVLAVNKIDKAVDEQINERLKFLEEKFQFSGACTISALRGTGVDELLEKITSHLQEGVPFFPEDMVTDQPLGFALSEIIREKLFELTMEEVPYSTAVVVEEISTEREDIIEVSAIVYVERETQKRIIIGKGGRMLRDVGTAARLDMEKKLGKKIYLQLWVKVKRGWTDREGLLRQMGYS